MQKIELIAEISSPVVISPASYIPGSTLRGAFAAKYIRTYQLKDPANDQGFQKLFLDEQVYFCDLIPGQHVLPATTYSCKRQAGFKQEGKHGIYDYLFANIEGEVLKGCPVCEQDLKRLNGFHGSQRVRKLETSITTHVGIDRSTETSAHEVLYSYAEIDAGQQLYGEIYASEECIELLMNLLEGSISAGKARTRGKGKVSIVKANLCEIDTKQMVLDWETWNSKAKEKLKSVWQWDFLFALTLRSEAILVDQLLRVSSDPSDDITWLPSIKDKQQAFGNGSIEFIRSFSQLNPVSGWNSVHKLPKNDDFSLQRGSVFVYGFKGNNSDKFSLQESLLELDINGMGIRKSEGFGQVTINDPFHYQYAGGDNL